ncbi:MAG: hypothetical protein JHC76_11930 [Akkermansiaceae bacterium]|nr:hypothetical protein [Akkermansiaceae bacterium]
MKTILLILVVAGAGILGYMAEPSMRSKLTGSLPNHPKATAVPQTDAIPEAPVQLLPEPSHEPAPTPPQDVAPVAEAAPEATPAEAVPETPAQLEPEPSPPPTEPAPLTETSPPIEPAPLTESVPPTEPAPLTESAPPTEPAPLSESAPLTESVDAPADADLVQVMQASIDAGQIKEFTKAQVLSWTSSTDEIAEGETYQIGLAAYKAETIFGIKTIQAKAMIQSGKVVRWIWPKSGMEIK